MPFRAGPTTKVIPIQAFRMEPKDLFRRQLPSALVEEPTLQNRNTFAYCECETGLHQPRLIKLCLADFAVSKALDEVIVYHSDRLHVGIDDRRTDEAESPVLEVLAKCVGFGRS